MIQTANVSSKPLFDWFAQDRKNRAKLRAYFSDGRITNWKRRGIPLAQVGNVAQLMGLEYEQYIELATREQVGKEQRRASAWPMLALLLALFIPDAKAISHNHYASGHSFAKSLNGLHKLGHWFARWFTMFRIEQFA